VTYVDSAPSAGVRQVVCRVDDIPAGQMRSFVVSGRDVLVIHGPHDTFYGLSNECTHAEANLDMGELLLDRCQVECPLHGGRFDFRTGEPTEEPCDIPVPVYRVAVDGGDVVVSF
jgi:nitrite reductase/ring-hydroxylating ferredoxin subunit